MSMTLRNTYKDDLTWYTTPGGTSAPNSAPEHSHTYTEVDRSSIFDSGSNTWSTTWTSPSTDDLEEKIGKLTELVKVLLDTLTPYLYKTVSLEQVEKMMKELMPEEPELENLECIENFDKELFEL